MPDNFSFKRDHRHTHLYNVYCRANTATGKGQCITSGEVVNAVTILLLNNLFIGNDIESENERNEYILYVMLWLSNKMKLITTGTFKQVADFYVTYIKNSEEYKDYINLILKNERLLYFNIGRMRKLYGLFNDLCNAINKHSEDPSDYSGFSKFATNWEEEAYNLAYKKNRIFEDKRHCTILSTLKNAYEKYRTDNGSPREIRKIKEIEGMDDCNKLFKNAKTRSKKLQNSRQIRIQKKPSGDPKKPSVNSQNPSVNSQNPSADSQKSSADSQKSSADSQKSSPDPEKNSPNPEKNSPDPQKSLADSQKSLADPQKSSEDPQKSSVLILAIIYMKRRCQPYKMFTVH